ncbi:MAG TPA: DNA-binding response regulator [Ktedonobacter sp.]|nr:DNA-binding response regulator [Ktedonobacter sp.]
MVRRTEILIVDDDEQLAQQLHVSLSHNGYSCSIVYDGRKALELLEHHTFELILLDIGLPGLSGLEVCRRLRAQSLLPPIIVLSVHDKEQEIVEAFDLGADDYVTKPFGVEVLIARMKVALRHAKSHEAPVSKAFAVGPFNIDPLQQKAQLYGKDLDLTRTEYKLLEVLCQNKGHVLTQKMLLYKVWGDNYGEERHYVHVYINLLRHKIEPDPTHHHFIKTEHGVGYRFIVEDDE